MDGIDYKKNKTREPTFNRHPTHYREQTNLGTNVLSGLILSPCLSSFPSYFGAGPVLKMCGSHNFLADVAFLPCCFPILWLARLVGPMFPIVWVVRLFGPMFSNCLLAWLFGPVVFSRFWAGPAFLFSAWPGLVLCFLMVCKSISKLSFVTPSLFPRFCYLSICYYYVCLPSFL